MTTPTLLPPADGNEQKKLVLVSCGVALAAIVGIAVFFFIKN
jgi:hypothetical protein